MYYIHKDYLVSFETITDEHGQAIEKLSFDPCLPARNEMKAGGRRRNATDWTYENVLDSFLFDRGFTGHEHLDNFDLINMNGRLYDPWLGRFLQPDPFVQAPEYSQNFNRYSYAWNNPLKYTDPDGEWVNLVLGAVVGGISGYIAGDMAGATGWDLVAYIGVGAVAGAATAGIGSGVSSALTSVGLEGGFVAGAITGTTAGFAGGVMTGTGFSLIEGNTFDDALNSGLKAGGIGAATGFAMGGVIGGLDAISNNNNFWTGGAKGSMPEVNRFKVAMPEQKGFDVSRYRTEMKPLYKNSEMFFDGQDLYMVDNYSNGQQSLRTSWKAWSGGRTPKPQNVFGGRIPNGDWDLINIQRGGLSSYIRYGEQFYGDLVPRFSLPAARTGGFEIHPEGGLFGTGGCIGLQTTKQELINFYTGVKSYLNNYGSMSVYVNY